MIFIGITFSELKMKGAEWGIALVHTPVQVQNFETGNQHSLSIYLLG